MSVTRLWSTNIKKPSLVFFLLALSLSSQYASQYAPKTLLSLRSLPFLSLLFNSHPLSSHSTPLPPPLSSRLKTLTLAPHLAGTPSSSAAAAYVHLHLGLSGLQTLTSNYSSLLSHPSSSFLSLLNPNLSLALSEPADAASLFVPPYHAFSPSGAAIAPAVYANYGRDRDYETLQAMNVDVNNCIVIVRRGVVVERAAESGAKAVLMFGVKAEDGGVERGTVLIGGPGDMRTPGWVGGERLGMEVGKRFPRIPSMPVSLGTTRDILKMPEEWRGEVIREWGGLGGGGGGEDVLLNFTYKVNFVCLYGIDTQADTGRVDH